MFQFKSVLQSVTQKWPLTFEQLMMPNGLVMYETVLPFRIVSIASCPTSLDNVNQHIQFDWDCVVLIMKIKTNSYFVS